MTVYRDDVEALAARHAALAGEVAAKQREADEAGRLLAEARARTRLPVLDDLRIASPCSADWSKMTGDDRVRHCAACDQDVFNLSAMTRDEAQALVAEKAGKLCARYYQRQDGTILLADCTVGARRRRRRRWVAAGAAALLTVGTGAALVDVREVPGAFRVHATAGVLAPRANTKAMEPAMLDVDEAPAMFGSPAPRRPARPPASSVHPRVPVAPRR